MNVIEMDALIEAVCERSLLEYIQKVGLTAFLSSGHPTILKAKLMEPSLGILEKKK